MAPPLDLSVVVPAFNEAGRIGSTLHALRTHLADRAWTWEIVVADDGSTDGTRRVVEQIAATDARIVLLREPHRGKGGAVRAGMLAASGAHRFMCDADLSMPVHEIDRFMPPALGDAEIAIGTREGVGARRVGEPVLRHLAGRGFNVAVRALMVPGVHDTQCGFKMFTAGAADAVFPDVTVEGWGFDIEVLYLARRRGLRVREIPIEWHYRRESRLHLVRDGWGMFVELMRIRRRARSGRSRAARPERGT
jgi:glycosyltransferase involved in cell wall biosynthesis